MLAEHERADAAHVRRRERVAGDAERAAAEPRRVDLDAPCVELDRPQRARFSLVQIDLLGLFAGQAAIALDLL